jgi:hypothetical protein
VKKPEYKIDIDAEGTSCLEALSALSNLRQGVLYHEIIDSRHPLGIYNISIGRVCDKIAKCCEKLEQYFNASTDVSILQSKFVALRREVLDYLELSIYSAAEHVDDSEAIAKCFFKESMSFAKSPVTKRLKTDLKNARKLISAFANLIKHHQSRIGLLSVEFVHDSVPMCLHGIFAEEFSAGAVRPKTILSTGSQQLMSITGFLWDIVVFVLAVSAAIKRLILNLSAVDENALSAELSKPMAEAITALTRLPLYSFDEDHPFVRTRLLLQYESSLLPSINSGLYGSMARPWSKNATGSFGQLATSYECDGATTSFVMLTPTNLHLHHCG